MKYSATKTFGNDRGLSCCFRQWKATHSHCSTLHGYSIGLRLVFESSVLDARNWVYDFGGFVEFKKWMTHMFDHTVIIAKDDPHLSSFIEMSQFFDPTALKNSGKNIYYTEPFERGAIVDLRIVDNVGCEAFAKMAYDEMHRLLVEYLEKENLCAYDLKLKSVEVFEHGANSATYQVD